MATGAALLFAVVLAPVAKSFDVKPAPDPIHDPNALCSKEKAFHSLRFGRKPKEQSMMFHLGW